MSSERAAPFASKPPDEWDSHVEAMRATRMFLLQKMGPTRFVVRGDDSDGKYTVLIGNRAHCSCGVHLCMHHMFVMLKVLKVPPTNPLAWQTALVDSEVDYILGCGFDRGKFVGKGRSAPTVRREFLRRGSGRGCAGRSTPEATGGNGDQGGATRRLNVVAGEVCPVCQEEMEAKGDGTEVTGGLRWGESLTYCRDGCGNNMHARCMLMYAEHRRSTGERPCCPLCRVDWGAASLRALKEDARHRKNVRLRGRNLEVDDSQKRENGVASTGDRQLVPVVCRICKVKVHATFFRCLICIPPGSWDLCRRCYAASGVGSDNNNGFCTLVGRHRHLFVQGEASVNPPNWKPADLPERKRSRLGPSRQPPAAASAALISLQGREITTADFDLLLTLDASPTPPLHEHLLRALPAIMTQEHGTTTTSNERTDGTTSTAITFSPRVAETARASSSSPNPVTSTCCYCSHGGNGACRTTAPPSSTTDQQHPDSLAFRRLPCGHSAHDTCLIPILLEGIGGGDPASCLCPIDAFTLFPVLSRHRRHRHDPVADGITRDPGEVSNDSQSQGGASALATRASDHAVSRHAKVDVLREVLQRRGMGSGSGGGTTDILGLTLIGSGLALATPPATSGGNTGPSAISEGVKGVRTFSAPEPGSSRYPLEGSRRKSAKKMKSISGHREGCKNSTGILNQTQSVVGSRTLDHDELGGVRGMMCSIAEGARSSGDDRNPWGRSTGVFREKRTGTHRRRSSLVEGGASMLSSVSLPLSDR